MVPRTFLQNSCARILTAIFIAAAALLPSIARADIYITQAGAGIVSRFSNAGNSITPNFITGLTAPRDLTISGNDLYVDNYATTGSVAKYNALTGALNNAFSTPVIDHPRDMFVSGNNLYISSIGSGTSTGTIGVYNATTGAAINPSLIVGSPANGLNGPIGLVVSGGNLFVVNHGLATGSQTISEYDAATGNLINPTLISNLTDPFGLALAGTTLFVANTRSGVIGEYDTSGNPINSNLIPSLNGNNTTIPYGVAVLGSDLYVNLNALSAIGHYSTSGSLLNAALISSVDLSEGIAVTPEPASLSLLLIAAIPMVLRRRRR